MMKITILVALLLTGLPTPLLAAPQSSPSAAPALSQEESLIAGCFNDGYQGRNTLKIDQYIGNALFIDNFRAYELRYQRFLTDPADPFRPEVRANLLKQPQHYTACAKAQYQGYKTRLVEIWPYFEARLEEEVQGRAQFQQSLNCAK